MSCRWWRWNRGGYINHFGGNDFSETLNKSDNRVCNGLIINIDGTNGFDALRMYHDNEGDGNGHVDIKKIKRIKRDSDEIYIRNWMRVEIYDHFKFKEFSKFSFDADKTDNIAIRNGEMYGDGDCWNGIQIWNPVSVRYDTITNCKGYS